jgi:hypothetical protein
MCKSVDIVWKSVAQNFGFDSLVETNYEFSNVFSANFYFRSLAKKTFRLARKALYIDTP